MRRCYKAPERPDFSSEAAVHVFAPAEQRVPFIFSSPHSGRHYPQRFIEMSRLDGHQIRRSEDCYVDQLVESVVPLGAIMVAAQFPRSYVDANREPFELDAAMFAGRLPDECNTRSIRVASGLGTLPRIVMDGVEIYNKRLPVAEALMRIESCYSPYHAALTYWLEQTEERFGHAIMIDCHSMPSTAAQTVGGLKSDIIIGDRYGHSASPQLVGYLGELFKQKGYNVAYNRPYAGGFITEHYGSQRATWQALQIEICRGLYLNENDYMPTQNFATLKADLSACFADLTAMPESQYLPAIAAE